MDFPKLTSAILCCLLVGCGQHPRATLGYSVSLSTQNSLSAGAIASASNASSPASNPRLEATLQASEWAPGHEPFRAIDNDSESSWIASLKPVMANNSAWVVLDLGSVADVQVLKWRSPKAPYPVSAPSHYVVEVSTDGVEWIAVYEYNGVPVPDGKVPIGRQIRFVKLRTLKVNDGTGWALGFKEIWAEGSVIPNDCDELLNPQQNYLQYFKELGAHKGPHPFVICLSPGTYQGPIVINGAENILIRSHGGIATLEATISIPNLGIMPVPAVDEKSAALNIVNSTDVTVEGLRIRNNHVFIGTQDQKFEISRAISFLNNVRTTLRNCTILSHGKQVVHYQAGSDYKIINNHIEGYYFSIDSRQSNSYLDHNTLVTRDARVNDAHSVIFVFHTRILLENTSFINYSGKGIFTGAQEVKDSIVVQGTTTSFGLMHWSQMHPNYQNLKVDVRGTFPQLTPFWYNPYLNGGMSMGNQICFYSGEVQTRCEYK